MSTVEYLWYTIDHSYAFKHRKILYELDEMKKMFESEKKFNYFLQRILKHKRQDDKKSDPYVVFLLLQLPNSGYLLRSKT